MTFNTLKNQYRKHLNPINLAFLERNGLDKEIVSARGATLIDTDGKEYIDLVAGYGVHNFGHNPSSVLRAISELLGRNELLSRPFLNADLGGAAEALCDISGISDGRVFFCSTGAEAVDTGIKLARLSTRRSKIVAATDSFHGFTVGALSVSGIKAQRAPFEPLMPGVEWVPFGDVDALRAVVDGQTAAVILEPVQAEIGGIAPPNGYLRAAREITSAAGALLVVDEVRTGFWRTGTLFGYQHDDIRPDMILLGKSLGSGIVPVAAVISDGRLNVRADMTFSMSASSFSGNRLACVAARTSIALACNAAVGQSAEENTELAWSKLAGMPDRCASIIEKVTGQGLLIGLHFRSLRTAQNVVAQAIQRGVLVGAAFCNSKCILLEPPVNIERTLLESALDTIEAIVRQEAAD